MFPGALFFIHCGTVDILKQRNSGIIAVYSLPGMQFVSFLFARQFLKVSEFQAVFLVFLKFQMMAEHLVVVS